MPVKKSSNPLKSEKIEVRVTEELKRELKKVAVKKGISVSSLVTFWVNERLEQETSAS